MPVWFYGAVAAGTIVATFYWQVTASVSQIALPETISRTVYASATGYSASVTNMSRITLASDMVFGDDLAAREMATVTGGVSAGYVATLAITVDPAKTESGGGRPSA